MNFPKSELSKQDALHLWITCRSEYAKEQMFLTNYGIVFFVMQRLGIPAFDEDMFQIGSIGLLTKEVDNKRFIDCWCRLEAKNGVRI